MNYSLQYSQPFTLEDAIGFDVPVIMEEITRLENSLNHLRETQLELQSYLQETQVNPDVEICRALEENKVVIGSQEERIKILKMALTEKSLHYGSHYDTKPNAQVSEPIVTLQRHREGNLVSEATGIADSDPSQAADDEEQGVYL